jgi:FlaA1/EpsC-like NDP-sugar epimerase
MKITGLIVWEIDLDGLSIAGVPVLGSISALSRVLSEYLVDLVFITDVASPYAGEVIDTCADIGVEVRILPGPASVVRGDVRVSRRGGPEFALGRRVTTKQPHGMVVEAFRDLCVLVTGAGGSIGSELSRQVAQLPVSSLILFDQDENSIFELRNQLDGMAPQLRSVAVVGDIRDRSQLERVFSQFHPSVVLHAAAYKHVSVMEENCCEAVLNNVLGTLALAEVGAFFRAERFLMISTDKAVQPASVMGATKRVAELSIQYLAAKSETQFASVRFGNVLGSRGSVVPIFLKQIAAGGPITVTDEHMTRYFMTIPDAVRLVLHASSLGTQGDIFMLDMGDPIKIVDLARRLVRSCGLRPDIDIEIKFVGTRAGEKLHEQLWSEDANVSPTIFPEVFRVSAEPPPHEFSQYLRELIEMANERDEAAVLATLERMPINFRKSSRQIIAA